MYNPTAKLPHNKFVLSYHYHAADDGHEYGCDGGVRRELREGGRQEAEYHHHRNVRQRGDDEPLADPQRQSRHLANETSINYCIKYLNCNVLYTLFHTLIILIYIILFIYQF